APNAFHAKIMEANGVEACFVGTSITGGNYTGLPDLGILSMTECVGIARWIARSVKIPVILDGDTGHGGIMAVRRLVRECIDAGLAGLRVGGQTPGKKRRAPLNRNSTRCQPASRSSRATMRCRATGRRWTPRTRSILTSSSWRNVTRATLSTVA